MDPLISDGVDPGLLRIVDKRGQEQRDREPRRRRAPASEPGVRDDKKEKREDDAADAPQHELDDMA